MRRHWLGALGIVIIGLSSVLPAGAQSDDALAAVGNDARRLSNGHYEVTLYDGTVLLTHGPDPKPNHGSSMGIGDPERAPFCATDYYQHVLYGRPSTAPDRYSLVVSQIRAAFRRMNALLNEESLESGARTADYKVLCDGQGEIKVDSFTSGANDFTSISNAARSAGFNNSSADYTIYYDSGGGNACGIGSFRSDDRPIANNFNNDGGGYGIAYNQCWNNETAMHENGHNQGAVQYAAPYSTGSGAHCWDEADVMCYSPDSGDKHQNGTIDRCINVLHFDCEHDTYFDSFPESGEWLETHWNMGSSVNRFIVFGGAGNVSPVAKFSTVCTNMTCTFTDQSTDQDGTIVSRAWTFGDGGTSSTTSPSHTYATSGTYPVTLIVTDDDAATGQANTSVTVPLGDPDPGTPTLSSGVAYSSTNAAKRGWKYFKILVPSGRPSITARLDGPPCDLFGCTAVCDFLACAPDLELYVRAYTLPTTAISTCRSVTANTSSEVCTFGNPLPGYWYVGVYTAVGSAGWPFTITATF